MEIHFYPTGCGDAARISFKNSEQKAYHVFIDAGFERTFRQVLSEEIAAIASRGELISLWIISHIHDDHIGGAIGYINAVKAGLLPDIVDKWWYNPPRLNKVALPADCLSVSGPASIRQGDQLNAYLSKSRSWNCRSVGSEIQDYHVGDLKITTLSPGIEQLQRLREKYKLPNVPLEQIEGQQTTSAKSVGKRDYHLKVAELENVMFSEDRNIENGSSIGMLTDYYGFKILWLADAHPSVVAENLVRLGYSPENPIICDWVKVAHHGSAANNTTELYRLIECSNYVISVDGHNLHGLPNKAALVNILKSRRNPTTERYNFYFTHDDKILRSMFLTDGDSIFDELNFRTFHPGNKKSFKITVPDTLII